MFTYMILLKLSKCLCLNFMKFTMIMNENLGMKILMYSICPFDWKT